jgi:Obg family GTPase CgtA-like protein
MIPLSDEPSERARFPLVNVAFILLTLAIFAYEVTLDEEALSQFVRTLGVVPVEVMSGQDLPPPNPWPLWTTLFTATFLHGSWLHLATNGLYLWIFGDNVESEIGRVRYFSLFFLCGGTASLAQSAAMPGSDVPGIGASGAIAGVLASYLLLFPGNRVTSLVFVIGRPVRFPIPAFILITAWLLLQLANGLLDLGVDSQQTEGVAYWAHIGGFVAGFLATGLAIVSQKLREGIASNRQVVLPGGDQSSERRGDDAAGPLSGVDGLPTAQAIALVGPLDVRRVADAFVVRSSEASRFADEVDLSSERSLETFRQRMGRLGVVEALAQAGAEPGDLIRVGPLELNYEWLMAAEADSAQG